MTSEAMRPFSLRFEDPALEQAFWEAFAERRVKFLQTGIVLLPLLFASFGVVDAFVFRDHFAILAAIRYALCMPLMLAAWPVALVPRYRALFRRRVQEIVLGLGLVATGGILLMAAEVARQMNVREVVIGTVGMLITLTFMYGFAQVRFVYAAALGASVTALGSVVLLVNFEAPLLVWSSIVTFAIAVNGGGLWMSRTFELLERRDFVALRAIERERDRSERLLANVLPSEIAHRLREDDGALSDERTALADRHDAVSVLVADLVGFTPLSERLSPEELAAVLDRLFSAFDALAEAQGVEKIRTLGDAWIGASGVPTPRADHAESCVRLGLAMIEAVRAIAADVGIPLSVRVGVGSGSAVAGVIGRTRFAYDLWGEAVDEAKRMEQGGAEGRVRISDATAALVRGRRVVERDADSLGGQRVWAR